MSIARHQASELKLYLVRYDLDIWKRVLKPGPTWAYKEAEMAALKEGTLNNINDPERADEVELLQCFLGQVEAAKMVCQAKGILAELERDENPPPVLRKVLADQAEERPICFCEHFWVVEEANGNRRAFARGRMQKIELSLSRGALDLDPEHQVAELFSFLMAYSHFAGQNTKMKSLADEHLSRLIHEKLLPPFLNVPPLPSGERDAALKSLRSMLISAFDAASRGNDFKLHRGREVVEWSESGQNSKNVLPAWAAIQHAKTWLARNLTLPSKAELKQRMVEAHPELRELAASLWAGIWKQAGLEGLPKRKPIIERAKGQLDKVRAKFTKTARKS